MGYEWFTSFDAIPGVVWRPLVPIDRSKLRGLDARPHLEHRPLLEDRSYLHVEWLTHGGRRFSEESDSPASAYKRKLEVGRELAPLTIAKSASEMLALPGTREDYHFGMMSAWSALHGVRRRDLRAYGWVEALCLADISLMELGPELVFPDERWSDLGERGGYPVVPAFHHLSGMYQREGFLAAAVEVDKRCAALGGTQWRLGEEAIARQNALLEEDGR